MLPSPSEKLSISILANLRYDKERRNPKLSPEIPERIPTHTRLTDRKGEKSMDNGASSYRRFLDGDDEGIVEIIRDYKDGLILYLNGFTRNISTAEELMEETFVKLATRKPRFWVP